MAYQVFHGFVDLPHGRIRLARQRLREGFLRIVEANPQRCVLIDAVGSLEQVEARVWQAVQDRLL